MNYIMTYGDTVKNALNTIVDWIYRKVVDLIIIIINLVKEEFKPDLATFNKNMEFVTSEEVTGVIKMAAYSICIALAIFVLTTSLFGIITDNYENPLKIVGRLFITMCLITFGSFFLQQVMNIAGALYDQLESVVDGENKEKKTGESKQTRASCMYDYLKIDSKGTYYRLKTDSDDDAKFSEFEKYAIGTNKENIADYMDMLVYVYYCAYTVADDLTSPEISTNSIGQTITLAYGFAVKYLGGNELVSEGLRELFYNATGDYTYDDLDKLVSYTGFNSIEEVADVVSVWNQLCAMSESAAKKDSTKTQASDDTPYKVNPKDADISRYSLKIKMLGSLVSGSIYNATADAGVNDSGIMVKILQIMLWLMILWNFIKLVIEVAERYVITCVIFYLSPLAFATFVSAKTEGICKKTVQMYVTQCIILILNLWFINGAYYALCLAPKNFPISWMLMVMAFMICGQKIDEHINTAGGVAAKTGGALFDSVYMGYRALAGVVNTSARTVSGISKKTEHVADKIKRNKSDKLRENRYKAEHPQMKLSANNLDSPVAREQAFNLSKKRGANVTAATQQDADKIAKDWFSNSLLKNPHYQMIEGSAEVKHGAVGARFYDDQTGKEFRAVSGSNLNELARNGDIPEFNEKTRINEGFTHSNEGNGHEVDMAVYDGMAENVGKYNDILDSGRDISVRECAAKAGIDFSSVEPVLNKESGNSLVDENIYARKVGDKVYITSPNFREYIDENGYKNSQAYAYVGEVRDGKFNYEKMVEVSNKFVNGDEGTSIQNIQGKLYEGMLQDERRHQKVVPEKRKKENRKQDRN